MKTTIFAATVAAGFLLASAAFADNQTFCAGWASGWEAAFQNRGMMVAMTPMCPMPKMGQDNFQGGYEAGLLAALNQIAERR